MRPQFVIQLLLWSTDKQIIRQQTVRSPKTIALLCGSIILIFLEIFKITEYRQSFEKDIDRHELKITQDYYSEQILRFYYFLIKNRNTDCLEFTYNYFYISKRFYLRIIMSKMKIE